MEKKKLGGKLGARIDGGAIELFESELMIPHELVIEGLTHPHVAEEMLKNWLEEQGHVVNGVVVASSLLKDKTFLPHYPVYHMKARWAHIVGPPSLKSCWIYIGLAPT